MSISRIHNYISLNAATEDTVLIKSIVFTKHTQHHPIDKINSFCTHIHSDWKLFWSDTERYQSPTWNNHHDWLISVHHETLDSSHVYDLFDDESHSCAVWRHFQVQRGHERDHGNPAKSKNSSSKLDIETFLNTDLDMRHSWTLKNKRWWDGVAWGWDNLFVWLTFLLITACECWKDRRRVISGCVHTKCFLKSRFKSSTFNALHCLLNYKFDSPTILVAIVD